MIFFINEIIGSFLFNLSRKIISFCSSYVLPKILVSSVDNEPYDYTSLEKITDLPCSKNRKIFTFIIYYCNIIYSVDN